MKIKPSKPLLLSWIPALVGMGILFYASSLPGDKIHLPPFPYSDKAVHFSVYAILGALIASRKDIRRHLESRTERLRTETLRTDEERAGNEHSGRYDFKAVAVGALFGYSDEVHQLYVPMRSYDYLDMTADAMGVALGCFIYLKISESRKRRTKLAAETGRERANPGTVRG